MTFSEHVDRFFLVLWNILIFFWIAFLTYRYLRFGPVEIGLLGSHALMVSAAMIARAIRKHRGY